MTLFRSLSVQWLATVYVAGFSMMLTIFLARLFGPEVFGEYSYIVTFASLFAIFQDGGFRTLLFREFTSSNLTYKNDDLFSKASRAFTGFHHFGNCDRSPFPSPKYIRHQFGYSGF